MEQSTVIKRGGRRTSPAEVQSTCGCTVRGAPPFLPGAAALFDRQVIHTPSVVQAVVEHAAGGAAIATSAPRFLHKSEMGLVSSTSLHMVIRLTRLCIMPGKQKTHLAEALHGLWEAVVHNRPYCALQIAHPTALVT